MYKVEILSDRIEQEAINRRRRLDQERKERIFNPRVRILGVDMEAIEQQIQIKQQLKSEEKSRNDAIDKQSRLNANILTALDDKVKMARRKHLEKINIFRTTEQKTHQRRDYDLYDPLQLRKEISPRTLLNDFEFGASSLQKFDGEDLDFAKRQALQKKQMQIWTDQRIQEQEIAKKAQLEEKKKYDNFQMNLSQKMNALQNAVEQAKRDQARHDYEYNLGLVNYSYNPQHEEKKQREREQKLLDTELSIKEINSQVNGIFLTETPNVFDIKGGHKVRVDVFKGFTPQQNQEIKHIQQTQVQEHAVLNAEQKRQQQTWDSQAKANQRALELLERDRARKQKEIAIKVRLENQEKAIQDQKRNQLRNQYLNNNRPNDEYFNQFNTTSR